MRSGNCTVQQTLTAEAASVLKHSLGLARRRGHAQVTPLHVAATLLTSKTSLLRRACLKSQPPQLHSSHLLQCRALELCFNVALNRLPTSPGPLIQSQPSLSNALIAALKRAQAHQRRGCIEQQQQQPLLTVKVELEQLIVSILDDPSVSRVMREAGFSSTCVKSNIEDCSSSSSSVSSVFHGYGVFSSPSSPTENPWQTHFLNYSPEKNPLFFSTQRKVLGCDYSSDVKVVFEAFNRRKNTVIVGDSVSVSEGVVGEVMGRFERGEVPLELKKVQFVKFQFAPVSLKFMKKEDVERNVLQLRSKVESIESGVVIYIGDVRWTVEEIGEKECGYSSVEHLVREIGRIVSDFRTSLNGKKVWLMGTASFQTYMRCQMRQPSLEIQWGLQPVSVPSGGLALSLHASSNQESRMALSQNPSPIMEMKPIIGKDKEEELEKVSCCPECTSSYQKEAQLFKSTHHKNLPPWLQPHCSTTHQKDELNEIRRKWNGLCQSLNHQGRNIGQSVVGRSNAYSSSCPWWSTTQPKSFISESNSISFPESNRSNSVPKFRRQLSCSTIDFDFGTPKQQTAEPNLDSLKNSPQDKELQITLALGSSNDSDHENNEKRRTDLCKFLQENVPWQCESVNAIADVVAGGKSSRRGAWMMIEGNDTNGKRRLAFALAEYVLGSSELLVHLNLRKGDTNGGSESFSDSIERAFRNQGKVVALIEDVDFGDTHFLNFIADAFSKGTFEKFEPVFILTKGGDSLDVQDSVVRMNLEVKIPDRKRKAEWDIQRNNKNARTGPEKEEQQHNISRQSSFNSTLDLNMKAGEGELSPISSDRSRILKSLIKNKFVFDKKDDLERETREELSRKMKKCVKEFGEENRIEFSIEEKV